MIPFEEQERLIYEQLQYLREQYAKACEPWLKQLSYIRSFRPSSRLILRESDFKARVWKEHKP